MPTELDRKFDEILAQVTGPEGRIAIGRDSEGRAVVTNLPGTVPGLFRAFCEINGDKEAVVAGDERLTFADLDRLSERLAHGLVARGVAKGDRVGIAMRNCPSWIVVHMAILKAGAISTLLNGWWEPLEMEHAVQLTEPVLIIADAPRARRLAERCHSLDVVSVTVELPVEQALAELLALGSVDVALPDITPE